MSNAYSVTHIPEENIYKVENPGGGPTLTFSLDSGIQIIEVQDGPYARLSNILDGDLVMALPMSGRHRFTGFIETVDFLKSIDLLPMLAFGTSYVLSEDAIIFGHGGYI